MHILFVCTGNTCRSPMAEHLLRRMAADRGITRIDVRSGGIAPGTALTDGARDALAEQGITDVHHAPRGIDAALVDWADMIIAMDESHRRSLLRHFPDAERKTTVIRPGGIKDPYGGNAEEYRGALAQIRESLSAVIENLKR